MRKKIIFHWQFIIRLLIATSIEPKISRKHVAKIRKLLRKKNLLLIKYNAVD